MHSSDFDAHEAQRVATVLDTPEQINHARALVLRAGLRLEVAGMKRRGKPASQIIRELTGLKTRNKKVLLAEFNKILEGEL